MNEFHRKPERREAMEQTHRSTRFAPANDETIAAAAACLREGGLVAMPTETVYGLAGDATSDRAVAKIFAAKGRPTFNPLIAHVLDLDAAKREATLDADAETLARAFWPGPLTIVAPAAPSCRVSLLARAGLDTLAVRVPRHRVARALIAAVGAPLAAPSANRSGRLSPTEAAHVLDDLDGRIDWILDGGPTERGLESTIVACLGQVPALLRPGALSREEIEAVLGKAIEFFGPNTGRRSANAPTAPGQLDSHYAPRAAVRLEAHDVQPGEAALDFGGALAAGACVARLDLSPTGDLVEAAARLFACVRQLDATGVERIAVAPIPQFGLGAAINDRLRRASAPRPAGTPAA